MVALEVVDVLPHERRQVLAHGRIGDIGQAHLLQADRARLSWSRHREMSAGRSLEERGLHVLRRDVHRHRAADHRPALAHHRDREARRRGVKRAAPPSRPGTPAPASRTAPRRAGRRGVFVSTALASARSMLSPPSKQVIADRIANERQFPLLLTGADQAEIGRAAADIDDQAAHAGLEHAGFLRRVRAEPGIERGLRFLEQRDVLQPGLLRGLGGEVTGHVVERRRHRHDHGLFFEAILGLAVRRRVPGLDDVLEVLRTHFERREARHVRRSGPGQERRTAIDAGVRTATTWRSTPAGRAPSRRDCGRTGRRRRADSSSRADRWSRAQGRAGREDRGTTAGAAVPAPARPQPPAGC